MLIVALVLAVIGLAALVTAVVTSNEVIAWVCIAASAIGVLLLIIDAVRDRSRGSAKDTDTDAEAEPEAEAEAYEDYPEDDSAERYDEHGHDDETTVVEQADSDVSNDEPKR